jgi:hypothetical protein
MMQNISKSDNVQTGIGDCLELIDMVTVKNVIEIIELEHVAGHHAAVKVAQRGDATAYFQNCQLLDVSEIAELVLIQGAIPVKKIAIGGQPGAIAEGICEIPGIRARRGRFLSQGRGADSDKFDSGGGKPEHPKQD